MLAIGTAHLSLDRANSQSPTGLLAQEPSEVRASIRALFCRRTITSGHEKKADLGVLEGADHDGSVLIPPISTVGVVSVKFEVFP